MTDTTTHFGLSRPDLGNTTVWGVQINNDMAAIDTAMWNASGGLSVGVNTQSSASSITLTNQLSSVQSIAFTASGQNLILPPMNATDSMIVGAVLTVQNAGSYAFGILAQDGETNIGTLPAGATADLTLTSNATANGVWAFKIVGDLYSGNNLSDIANASAALDNILPSQTGNSGYFLGTNGTSPSWQPSLLTGTMIIWTTDTAPAGYLECNGSAISRSAYAALFSVIGTTFGAGDGSTTFNIPDMRGYFPRGWDDGAGRDPGRTFGSTQGSAFASHTHAATVNVSDPGHLHNMFGIFAGAGGFGGQDLNSYAGNSQNTSTSTTGINVSVSNASTGGSETRPINVALMFCIKT